MKREPISKLLVGSGGETKRSPVVEPNGKEPDQPAGSKKNGNGVRSASLYDDTLSGTRSERKWSSVVWVVLGLIVVGGMLAAVLTRPSDDKIAELEEFEPKELDRSSPLAQVVDGVRKRPDEELLTEEGSEKDSGDSTVAGKAAPIRSSTGKPVVETPSPPKVDPRESLPETKPPSPAPARTEKPVTRTPEPAATKAVTPPPVEVPAEQPREPEVPAEVEEPTPAEATVSEEDQNAYDSLLKNSPEANRLVSGGYATLEFKDWRVVQRTPAEIWVDLLGNWTTGGDDVHFIWSVNRKSGAVRALSEAARNLR